MLNLREYAETPKLLADYLPWACLVAPGVVLNKDGSFQTTFRYRGPDLESSTEAGLVAITARVNNVLRRFGSGWALFFEAVRVEAHDYPDCTFPDAVSWLIDPDHPRRQRRCRDLAPPSCDVRAAGPPHARSPCHLSRRDCAADR